MAWVSCVTPLPLAFMTKISVLHGHSWGIGPDDRVLANAIFDPSGDQEGAPSNAEWFVRFVAPVPSAFITKISARPPATLSNVIFDPSGDQPGFQSPTKSLLVSLVWPLPSAFIT